MNVPKRLIGRMVEVQWMDPCFDRILMSDSPVGRKSLATWVERGRITDVTGGIIKIEHSLSAHAGKTLDNPDEHAFTPVPECLIERLTLFVEEPDGGENAPGQPA